MKIKFSKSEEKITVGDKTFPAWTRVRNELNGQRGKKEVVHTAPDKYPYYPRRFPAGVWRVYKPIPKGPENQYLAPWFIPTDAHQTVDLWSVKNGEYFKKTGATYDDKEYGLHFSSSTTTLGCIRIAKKEDLLWLVGEITSALANKKEVTLEVVE